jgi:hypothetical protein
MLHSVGGLLTQCPPCLALNIQCNVLATTAAGRLGEAKVFESSVCFMYIGLVFKTQTFLLDRLNWGIELVALWADIAAPFAHALLNKPRVRFCHTLLAEVVMDNIQRADKKLSSSGRLIFTPDHLTTTQRRMYRHGAGNVCSGSPAVMLERIRGLLCQLSAQQPGSAAALSTLVERHPLNAAAGAPRRSSTHASTKIPCRDRYRPTICLRLHNEPLGQAFSLSANQLAEQVNAGIMSFAQRHQMALVHCSSTAVRGSITLLMQLMMAAPAPAYAAAQQANREQQDDDETSISAHSSTTSSAQIV